MKNIFIIVGICAITVALLSTAIGTSYAQKYSDQFKAQQSQEDHPCLTSGDPNMGTMVVQLRSDDDIEGASTDECLEYIDILIEQFGYKMFDVLSWGENEYTWTLN
jgi:hypothetical protein